MHTCLSIYLTQYVKSPNIHTVRRGAAQLLNFTCQDLSVAGSMKPAQFFHRLPYRQQREEALRKDVCAIRMYVLYFCIYIIVWMSLYILHLGRNRRVVVVCF